MPLNKQDFQGLTELAVPNPLAPSLPARCARVDRMTQDSAWPQTSVPGASDL